ncbi:unnamed protein product [Lymnaea stagnalis]|uniref:SOCS box domain-containing protein n=1 Tax=Lymnaea stagnalis TaxID=6523 RepID=A0AAV2HX11_LYMST
MLEPVNWEHVSFNELDMLLRVSCFSDELVIDKELSSRLTPLCLACKYNREDLVTVLLHHNAQVNKCSSFYNKQPLHFACSHNKGNTGIVRKIIEAEANLNAPDSDGNTCLHIACAEGNIPVVELLIKHGASVNSTDMVGDTPLVRACYAQSTRLVDILVRAGCDANVPEGLPLEIAIRASSVETLKLLIEGGASVHVGAYLSHASECGDIESMKILNSYGADVNKTNTLGMSPLQIACFSHQSRPDAVQLLLQWGADVHACSKMKETALHYACNIQDVEKIRLLLAYGADVNAQDTLRFSPLMMAMKGFSLHPLKSQTNLGISLVRLLLAAGARLQQDNLGRLKSTILFVPDAAEKKQELFDLLYCQVSQPSELQALCRVKIRKSVQPNIDKNVEILPLPPQLIRYLKFFDVIEDFILIE